MQQSPPSKRVLIAVTPDTDVPSKPAHRVRLVPTPRIRLVPEKERRAAANKKQFTDLGLQRLKVPSKQTRVWDTGQKGLSLLMSPGGTKTFFSHFNLNGKPGSRGIGRLRENSTDNTAEDFSVEAARAQCRADRALAREGKDPRAAVIAKKKAEAATKTTVEEAISRFVVEYCKDRQRSWDQCQKALLRAFRNHDWLDRPIGSITADDCELILTTLRDNGKIPTARRLNTWLKLMFRWLGSPKRDLVEPGLLLYLGEDLVFPKRVRDRVYTDAEIKAIWRAAEKLSVEERVYTHLLVLLAPRATALASMCWNHVSADRKIWTTPATLVKQAKPKSKTYTTQLPKYAQEILRSLKPEGANERLFPSLPIGWSEAERPSFVSQTLKARLIANGAPKGLLLHACRHTLATWLQAKGQGEASAEVLNHSPGGPAVTRGYMHAAASAKQLEAYEAWAAHIASLVK